MSWYIDHMYTVAEIKGVTDTLSKFVDEEVTCIYRDNESDGIPEPLYEPIDIRRTALSSDWPEDVLSAADLNTISEIERYCRHGGIKYVAFT